MHAIHIVLYFFLNKPFLSNLLITIIIKKMFKCRWEAGIVLLGGSTIIIFPPYHLRSYAMVAMTENLAARGGAEIPEN